MHNPGCILSYHHIGHDEFDPDPYMQMLNEYGLPWVVEENPETVA